MMLKEAARGRLNESPYTDNGDVMDLLHHFGNALVGYLTDAWQRSLCFRYAVAPTLNRLLHSTKGPERVGV